MVGRTSEPISGCWPMVGSQQKTLMDRILDKTDIAGRTRQLLGSSHSASTAMVFTTSQSAAAPTWTTLSSRLATEPLEAKTIGWLRTRGQHTGATTATC